MEIVLKVRVRGLSPSIMHNGQLANPLNPHAKAMKDISSKRTKTDADYEEMMRIEWRGGIYTDAKGHPVWPGENLESALLTAAAKLKLKTGLKPSLLVEADAPLIYEGPKTIDGLIKDPKFMDVRGVRIGKNRVMRTRPIFLKWELEFEVSFNDEDINTSQMEQIIRICGRRVGFSDYRPKFGRFEVMSIAVASAA